MELLAALALATTLAVPGRANATPSIAADRDFVIVAWSAALESGSTDIYAAASRDGGRVFDPPVRVNDAIGDARVNGEQPPRVTIVRGTGQSAPPTVVIVWTTKGASGTRLVQARSTDGGRTFARAATVPGSDAAGNRGWHAATADRSGRIDVLWLDHRELASDPAIAMSHHDHASTGAAAAGGEKPDGVAMAQKSKLMFASLDAASAGAAPTAVTGGVCYCCKTALAAGADGAIYAAWRHVYPGNLRDIAFAVSRNGGRTFAPPIRVSEDKWMLEGCPDDGPAMAVDATNRIHIVWPTVISDPEATIALFYAVSDDGRTFSARRRVPTEGMPHHPQIAISHGSIALAWDEVQNGRRRVAWSVNGRTIRPENRDPAFYPVIAATGDATIVAWTSGKTPDSTIQLTRFTDEDHR
jgi:hypothetical protein